MANRTHRITSTIDRERLCGAYDEGKDFIVLVATLGIRRTTAYSIVTAYANEGRTDVIGHRGGRPRVIDDETLDFLVLLIEADPCITLRQMKLTVRDIWPTKTHFNEMTFFRALEGELISLKMSRDCPQERNSQRVLNNRREHAQWMLQEGLNKHRIYVDEAGYNFLSKWTYGRGPLGERVNHLVAGQRGRNATFICAISDRLGIIYHEILFQRITKNVFNNLMPSLDGILGYEDAVIMDNAPIHLGIQETYPDMSIKYLPPYSPFLKTI